MRWVLVALTLAQLAVTAAGAARADAQTRPDATPDSARRADVPLIKTEYDETADSTTRSLSAYAIVDTSLTPPDTFAVELSQRWRGRGTVAPAAPVELALGRTRAEGLPISRSLRGTGGRRPPLVFLIDGTDRVRLEQAEYVSNAGASGSGRITFETARYVLPPAALRRIAASRTLRVWVGDRELLIDPAWRSVAADVVAQQTPAAGLPVRKTP